MTGREDARVRIYQRVESETRGGTRTFFSSVLGISLFVLTASLSVRQITAPATARPLLAAGIVATTDLDQVVAEHGAELRQLAATTGTQYYALPGYPVAIVLSRDEIAGGDDRSLCARVLEQSTALVYEEGLDAFDASGGQSLRMFSLENGLKAIVGQVNATTHQRATVTAIVSALVAALAAVGVMRQNAGFTRFRAFGLAALGGAVPGLLGCVAIVSLVLSHAGGSDPYTQDVRTILETALAIPRRNYLVVTVAGLALALAGVLLSFAARRLDGRFGGAAAAAPDDDAAAVTDDAWPGAST
jgi:hypothetical protein